MLYVINSFAEKAPWPFNQDSWPGVVAGACNPALRRLIRKAAAAGRHFKKNINEYNPPSKGKIGTNVRLQQNLKSREQSPGQLPSEQQARKVTVWSVRADPSTSTSAAFTNGFSVCSPTRRLPLKFCRFHSPFIKVWSLAQKISANLYFCYFYVIYILTKQNSLSVHFPLVIPNHNAFTRLSRCNITCLIPLKPIWYMYVCIYTLNY